jgi:hypothetical protein
MGGGALRTVTALDRAGRLEHGPPAYVVVFRKVLPRWSIALLVAALLIPALVASVDALARASRRGDGVARWWAWALAGALPFLAAYAVAELLVLAGAIPDAPPVPVPPELEPVEAGSAVSLLGLAATAALAWVLLRPLAARWLRDRAGRRRGRARRPGEPRREGAAAPGAGAVVSLALALVVTAIWLFNPFAALALVPAVHCWMLALLTSVRRGVALTLLALGLLVPAAIALLYLARLALDPLEGAWYALLLVTGGHVDPLSALAGCVLLGLLGCALAAVVARRADAEPEVPREQAPRVRGPGGYAGPGSLGGTESALRR